MYKLGTEVLWLCGGGICYIVLQGYRVCNVSNVLLLHTVLDGLVRGKNAFL
jgi:hypothetical protein